MKRMLHSTHAAAATGAEEVMLRDGEVMARWR